MGQDFNDTDSLRRFDLNLLVTFGMLSAERSITATATRVGVGQRVVKYD